MAEDAALGVLRLAEPRSLAGHLPLEEPLPRRGSARLAASPLRPPGAVAGTEADGRGLVAQRPFAKNFWEIVAESPGSALD
jgi:hypothetical protein